MYSFNTMILNNVIFEIRLKSRDNTLVKHIALLSLWCFLLISSIVFLRFSMLYILLFLSVFLCVCVLCNVSSWSDSNKCMYRPMYVVYRHTHHYFATYYHGSPSVHHNALPASYPRVCEQDVRQGYPLFLKFIGPRWAVFFGVWTLRVCFLARLTIDRSAAVLITPVCLKFFMISRASSPLSIPA